MRPDLNTLALPELFTTLVDEERLDTLLALAFEEDLGDVGDVTTSSLVSPDVTVRAAIVARSDGIIAGLPVVERVLTSRTSDLICMLRAHDGSICQRGDVLLELHGPLALMLPLERIVLNTLGRLCGIATLTRQFVDAVTGTRAKLCCTRKTTPGWRELEKYAVRCGGGWLHRVGLYDAMLVKDNHLGAVPADQLAPAIAAAARIARCRFDLRFVEVEVDTLEQLDDVLSIEAGVIDIVLLDNFELGALREAVRRRDARRPKLELEASGGVRLESVRAIAETGVERISCGAITHSAISLDVAMDLLGEVR
ncbi:MAG: carboxylating nicotinate-nucleotide diphosphorylase [Phycisphaerae bacterium]|nr:carboxylating nicotinate-nucleotide diphosphorylase [Phycisphaerae bacterium]